MALKDLIARKFIAALMDLLEAEKGEPIEPTGIEEAAALLETLAEVDRHACGSLQS